MDCSALSLSSTLQRGHDPVGKQDIPDFAAANAAEFSALALDLDDVQRGHADA